MVTADRQTYIYLSHFHDWKAKLANWKNLESNILYLSFLLLWIDDDYNGFVKKRNKNQTRNHQLNGFVSGHWRVEQHLCFICIPRPAGVCPCQLCCQSGCKVMYMSIYGLMPARSCHKLVLFNILVLTLVSSCGVI